MVTLINDQLVIWSVRLIFTRNLDHLHTSKYWDVTVYSKVVPHATYSVDSIAAYSFSIPSLDPSSDALPANETKKN